MTTEETELELLREKPDEELVSNGTIIYDLGSIPPELGRDFSVLCQALVNEHHTDLASFATYCLRRTTILLKRMEAGELSLQSCLLNPQVDTDTAMSVRLSDLLSKLLSLGMSISSPIDLSQRLNIHGNPELQQLLIDISDLCYLWHGNPYRVKNLDEPRLSWGDGNEYDDDEEEHDEEDDDPYSDDLDDWDDDEEDADEEDEDDWYTKDEEDHVMTGMDDDPDIADNEEDYAEDANHAPLCDYFDDKPCSCAYGKRDRLTIPRGAVDLSRSRTSYDEMQQWHDSIANSEAPETVLEIDGGPPTIHLVIGDPDRKLT